MNFRKLLYPFSILYGSIISLRNFAYDKGWKSSSSYDIPIISVGNLSLGGAGKSPMVEHLVSFLREDYKVGVLSRGYKRKTKGYLQVTSQSIAEEVGDEPLQFKQKFPDISVSVCEDRRYGIDQLKKHVELIILDDAFQHRKVKAAWNILLTPFDDLFIDDCVLPAGNLREVKSGMKRAQMIVVTKCPEKVPYAKLQEIQYKMNLQPHQSIYFSRIKYAPTLHSKNETLAVDFLNDKKFTLVTGIANPKPLVAFLENQNFNFTHKKFPDHHHFSEKEIELLKQEALVITTEKDYVRLREKLNKSALYYLPITTQFLNGQENNFREQVLKAMERHRKS